MMSITAAMTVPIITGIEDKLEDNDDPVVEDNCIPIKITCNSLMNTAVCFRHTKLTI